MYQIIIRFRLGHVNTRQDWRQTMPVHRALQNYASSFAGHRVLLYSLFSIGAVLAVVANALRSQSNFYSVTIYLSKSNGTVVVSTSFPLKLNPGLITVRRTGSGELWHTMCCNLWSNSAADILWAIAYHGSRGVSCASCCLVVELNAVSSVYTTGCGFL